MSINKLLTKSDEYCAHDSFITLKNIFSDETIMSYKNSQTEMNLAKRSLEHS